jgi:hypothetical protein
MSHREISGLDGVDGGAETFAGITVAKPQRDIATQIVTGLTLPEKSTGSITGNPLPLPDLSDQIDDAAVRCATVRIDQSGRIKNKALAQVLLWSPGEELGISLVNDCLALRPASNGPLTLGHDHTLLIPATVRRRCRIAVGQQLLLVAFPAHRLLLAHTLVALTRMLTLYHAPPQQQPGLPSVMTTPRP